MTLLSPHSLNALRAGAAQIPTFDRHRLASGIVHLGLGAFHRHCLGAARSDSGTPLVINDPGAPALVERLRSAGSALGAVQAALAHTSVFGDAAWPAAFAARLAAHLSTLRQGGMIALLRG